MSSYNLLFSEQAIEDIRIHKKSGNKAVVNKISVLLAGLLIHPYTGTRKLEPLKHSLIVIGFAELTVNID